MLPVSLDRYSGYVPTGVVYEAVSPGVTINGNTASSPTGGVFRICAMDVATSAKRYTDIPLDFRTYVSPESVYYFGDAANEQ